MAAIFISYRRVDTEGWAGRLFADLCRHFGSSQVFMDYADIPGGAKWEEVLTNALAKCDVLLALIGPSWLTCTRSDGRRRLDVPEDWVRNEVATALARDIKVVPVLFPRAEIPAETELPEDIRPLCKRQCVDISNARWNFDVRQLIEDLAKEVSSVDEDDVSAADTGIRALQGLIAEVPQVADAVGRSKEVIENTHRQLKKLRVFKTIHDALHTVEFECLRPMRPMREASGADRRLRPFRIKFNGVMRRIEGCMDGADMSAALRDDLRDQLQFTYAAMQRAEEDPTDRTFDEAVGELDVLVSAMPPRFTDAIADAASDLDLGRLLQLIGTMRERLPEDGAGNVVALESLFHGMNALGRLRGELSRQTVEHARLQSLDSKIRSIRIGGGVPNALPSEWRRVKRIRSRLEPPFSPPLEDVVHDLTIIETEIDNSLDGSPEEGHQQSPMDLIDDYSLSVASVFREVDTNLKEFCLRLGEVSQPLETILKIF